MSQSHRTDLVSSNKMQVPSKQCPLTTEVAIPPDSLIWSPPAVRCRYAHHLGTGPEESQSYLTDLVSPRPFALLNDVPMWSVS